MKKLAILLMILSFLTIVMLGGANEPQKNTAKASVTVTIIEVIKIDSITKDTIINLN